MNKFLLLMLVVSCLLAPAVQAQTLAIGDPAPELKVSQWVKGGPVEALDPAGTAVVEFWATWCGPCRSAIPHVTEMAKKFTDVTFIGVNVWEKGKQAQVTKFVQDMGDKMDYHIAIDTDDDFMAENWMKAAGQNGIPCAFVVHQGQVAWIGHPMSGLDKTLEEIKAGTFDMEKVRRMGEIQKRMEAFYERAAAGAADEDLAEEGAALEALDKELGLNPNGSPFVAKDLIQMARFQTAMEAYQKALVDEAGEEDIARLESMAAMLAPESMDFDKIKGYLLSGAAEQKNMKLAMQYLAAVGEDSDPEAAAKLAARIESAEMDSESLNNLAWAILTDEEVKTRDLPLATRLAQKAVEATEGKAAHILDTYARALFDSGQVAEAIEVQKNAAETAPDDEEISAALKRYLAAAEAAAPAPVP